MTTNLTNTGGFNIDFNNAISVALIYFNPYSAYFNAGNAFYNIYVAYFYYCITITVF